MFKFAAMALIVFGTTAWQAAPVADTAEKSADNRDKMICKRFLETGSLVKGYRECKTKKEWDAARDSIRSHDMINSCAEFGSDTCRAG